METTNNRKLIASAALIVASVALLLGLTFAWFTDTAANKGNKIQAGTLGITATVASYDAAGDVRVAAGELGTDMIPDDLAFGAASDVEAPDVHVIQQTNWEPGQRDAKLLTVTNAGDLATKIKLQFDIVEGGLTDALWYDFVLVEDGVAVGQFTQRPMSTLETVGRAYEGHVAPGESVQFLLLYGMSENAGNRYQGKAFEADVSVVAAQDTAEVDGFGNADYDKDAAYPTVVSTAEEFDQAIAAGGIVQLAEDLTVDASKTIGADTTIDLQGNTLVVAEGTQSIKAASGTTLTIEGDGAIDGVVYADKGAAVVINAGDDFSVNALSSNGWAVYGALGSRVAVHGGTYTSSQKGAGVIHVLGSSLSVENAAVVVGSASVMNSSGVYSNAPETYLENVQVQGSYSVAVDLKNANGSSVIRGGSFSTDKSADGFASPTIRYQGTLEISDAVVTRVSTGILFSRSSPKPTEVEGLTCSNVTFVEVDGATGQDIDYKH